MATPKTGQQIIEEFRLYVDDSSELSSAEEVSLLNKIYHKVLDHKDWEFLRKEHTATASITVPYISLPSDFKNIAINWQDNWDGEPSQVVFLGTKRITLIPFSMRRNYDSNSNFCYIDARQNRLYFCGQPTSADSISFDYIYIPDDLTTITSPVFNATHHSVIMHGMVVDFYSIEQTDKARSYYEENLIAYQDFIERMSRVNLKQYGSLNY